jgi:ABC-type multidrug transport system fused ATPase/permease subunit
LARAEPWSGVWAVFRRFWPETRPFRGRLVVSLVLTAAGPLLGAVGIWLFKILVDEVLTGRHFALFPPLAAVYIGITLGEGLVSFADDYLTAWLGENLVLAIRTRLFDHLQRLSLGFFERHELGDILSRLTGDIGAIEDVVLSSVAQTLSYGVQILAFGGALFYLNWRLALVALLVAPAFLLLARWFSGRIRDASREKRRRAGSITAVAEESLSNLALVQAYDRQGAESARFRQENLASVAAQLAATRLQALFSPMVDLFEVLGVLLVVGVAIWELAHDRITLGGLLVFLAYLSQLYGPVRGFGRLSNSVFAASAGAERVIDLLDKRPTVSDPPRPRRLPRAGGALTLRRVGFTYPGADRPALVELTLTVPPGQKLAVVGPSGAGKSTLAKLLLRFYDPDLGQVALDGVDLRELALADLRRTIAAVLQETLVFDGTVAENIRLGKPDATDAEIRRAAATADAHDFIRELPDGYQTRIGQRGRLLSGGQRQRLAIARAMIRDAPVLLLDEPTTGLDAASTQRVMAPLRRLMTGRTTIIISHNLLTVADADQVVYLDHGRVTGRGTHTRLLATHPGYAHLYHRHHPAVPDPAGTPEPEPPPGIPTGGPGQITVARRDQRPPPPTGEPVPGRLADPGNRPRPSPRPRTAPPYPPDAHSASAPHSAHARPSPTPRLSAPCRPNLPGA